MIRVFSLSFVFLLFSCQLDKKPTIVKEDDSESNDAELSFYEYKNKQLEIITNQLKLPGADTLIRIWTKYEATNGGQVTSLLKSNSSWSNNMVRYFEHFQNLPKSPTYSDYLKSIRFRRITDSTFNNIKLDFMFLKRLDSMGLKKLRNQDQYKDWTNTVKDGLTYSLEYIDANDTVLVTYNCPDIYRSQFENNDQFYRILKLIDNSIDLKVDRGIECKK